MTEIQKASGIIAGINQKDESYGFTFEADKQTWYNGKGNCPCNKGDQVDITFKVNGQWNNIEQVYQSQQPASGSQPVENSKDRDIKKAVALKAAVKCSDIPNNVLGIADEFFNWLSK